MIYELFIGLRYLRAKRRNRFISLITAISMAGVALGVMALVVVMAVMSGFEDELKTKILGTMSHVVVTGEAGAMGDYDEVVRRVRSVPGVSGATPYVESQVMCASVSGASGLALKGVDIETLGGVIDLHDSMREGSLSALSDPDALLRREDGAAGLQAGEAGDGGQTPSVLQSLPGLLIGRELSKNLGAVVGDEVRLISPAGRITPMGVVPRVAPFRVVGIFETGLYEHDSSYAYALLSEAQKFLSMVGAATGVAARVDDIFKVRTTARRIRSALDPTGGKVVREWTEMNRRLFSAMRLEKIITFIVLTLIIMVGAFNIVSALIMMVMEKRREIAVLKTMGATTRSVMKIFMADGLIIGAAGTAVGLVSGFVLCALLGRYQFVTLPSDVFYNYTLPVNMRPVDFLLVGAAAIGLSFLATLYPSRAAARVRPAEALRYE